MEALSCLVKFLLMKINEFKKKVILTAQYIHLCKHFKSIYMFLNILCIFDKVQSGSIANSQLVRTFDMVRTKRKFTAVSRRFLPRTFSIFPVVLSLFVLMCSDLTVTIHTDLSDTE